MLSLVLSTTDLAKLKNTILSVPLHILLLIFIGYVIGQIISSVKWWLIAKNGEIDVPYITALKSYFIGMFVNCFGLGVVGGDVTRGLLLSHGKPQKTPAIASVLADRLHGLAVLSLLCILSFLYFDHDNLPYSLKYLLLFITFAVIIGWFVGPLILLKIIPADSKYRRKAEQLCHVFPVKGKIILQITILSITFHLTQILLHLLIGKAFGVTLSIKTLLTVIPIVNILSTLPISWNGLGVREKSYSYFLTPKIISQEQAVAFGAIWLLSVTVSSAIGGIISIITKDFESVSHIEQSDDYMALEKENAS